MRKLVLLALFSLAACSVRPVVIQSPAPEGAIDCALARATEHGFYPLDGGKDAGFIKLARKNEYTAGQIAAEATARLMSMGLTGSDRTEYEHLTLTGAGGILRAQIIGISESGEGRPPSSAGVERVQQIVEACTAASNSRP